MAILDILHFPDARLRNKAKPVSEVDESVRRLIDDMFETMYDAPGIGLAAIQVNEPARVIVVDTSEDRSTPLALVNPEVIEKHGEEEMDEGCLSVPGVYETVQRADSIRVRALDRDGKPFEMDADGLLAVCIQHEIDHLDGKLFVDYLSNPKRQRIRKKLEKEARQAGDKAQTPRASEPQRLAATVRPAGAGPLPLSAASLAAARAVYRDPVPNPEPSMTDSKRIVFAGTPEFSVPPLRALLQSAYEVVAVYTQPDRPAGRGRKLSRARSRRWRSMPASRFTSRPISRTRRRRRAGRAGGRPDGRGRLRPVAAARRCWMRRGSAASTSMPRCCRAGAVRRRSSGPCWPEMRNPASPSCRWRRDWIPGQCTWSSSCRLSADETGGSLHDRLSVLGAEALMKALPGILDGTLEPQPQDDAQACYAKKLDKAEAVIDWTKSAADIERQVRAFNPWPVAQTLFEDANLRIWRGYAVKGVVGAPGMVMNADRNGIDVATGDGLLRVTELQLPGKRAMAARDFINANSIQGTVLGSS